MESKKFTIEIATIETTKFELDKTGTEPFVLIYLASNGYFVKWTKRYSAGYPDLECIDKNGNHFFVEVKGPNDSLRMAQIDFIQENKNVLVIQIKLIEKTESQIRLESRWQEIEKFNQEELLQPRLRKVNDYESCREEAME